MYEMAINILEKIYVKMPIEIFARQILANRRQKLSESLDEFL